MRRRLATIIGFGLALIIFLCAMVPAGTIAADKPIKWRMGCLYPRGVSFAKTFPPFVDLVKTMSNGRLEIEMVYEGEGLNSKQMFSALKSGLLEMGYPYMALHAGEMPAGVVELGLPGGPGNYAELLAMVMEGGWKDELKKAYAKHGIVYLVDAYQPGPYLVTKKPIRNLDELKELKIRAPGAYGKFVRKLGASPVVITFSELYTALVTGVIDGVTGPNLVDYADSKIYEVAKYLYPLQVASAQVSPILVNKAAWNKMPDDLKAILKTASLSLRLASKIS